MTNTNTNPTNSDGEDVFGSVWATGQDSPRAQRSGYAGSSTAHPAKMLPAIARHAIGAYSTPGDIVLDPMCGIGTTLVEAVRLGRHAIGVEYEPRWAAIAATNLHLARAASPGNSSVSTSLLTGDARSLTDLLPVELHGQVALVVTSPPYGSSLHGQVTAVPGEGVVKSGDTYHPDHNGRDRGNLADQPLPELHAGLVAIFTGCRALLRPGGILAVTARPYRRDGALIDFPGVVVTAAIQAGLVPHERCVALMAAWRNGTLVARPSFFQLDHARKQTAAGRPTAVIVHEDLLAFTNPPALIGDARGEVA